jgi:hypothetical protein
MGPSLRRGRGLSFYVGAAFVAPYLQHEYIRAVTAFGSLWSLCFLCHCRILSNVYTRYTEVFCQCSDLALFRFYRYSLCTDSQRTQLPSVPLLLHDVDIGADQTENIVPNGYVEWRGVFHCCITVFLCHNLVTDVFSD